MEDQFLNYTQSLALKELGFDEPCFAYYGLNNVEDKIFFDIDPDDGELTSLNQNQFYHNNLSEIGRISAPLKQQVFRWFRDKHKLNHWIDLNFRTQKYILQIWRGRECLLNDNSMKSYEEAESAYIDKLIELVKNK